MSQSINWDLLEDQYLSDGVYREKLSKMVTIVDEAFLAGKKFARTFSTNIDPKIDNAEVKSESPPPEQKREKKVDITYNETASEKEKEAEDRREKSQVPNVDPILQTLNADLKRLLIEGKVSQGLYEKLTSNDKFELGPDDIEDINRLTDVKEVLLKLKGGKYVLAL